MQENTFVDWVQKAARSDAVGLLQGIGDDGAVLDGVNGNLVVTTDLICDGTHFVSEASTANQIGRKAMAVNLSDIAAMAAAPVAAFVSLLLPRSANQLFAEDVMASIIELGRQFNCPVAGGDTNVWDGKLAINVVVLGQTTDKGPLLRSTAKPGDKLLVTGTLGGSIAGHHFDFTPRIREALLLHEKYNLHAGMDLSDGLAMDLRRLCAQSGCGAEVLLEALPISAAARSLSPSVSDQAAHALGDGEDFELLLAVPPDDAAALVRDQPLDVPLTQVGQCISGSEVWQIAGGQRVPMMVTGYEHGGSRD